MLKSLFLASFIEKIEIARTRLAAPTKSWKATVPLLGQNPSIMTILIALVSAEVLQVKSEVS